MKKAAAVVAFMVLVLVLCVGAAFAADYPTKNINGYISWGAGGGTDNASRALTPIVEQILGGKIILQNKPGAAGALGTTQVFNMAADGYSLLYNAEGGVIYKVLGLGQYDYSDFEPLVLMLFGTDVICVAPETPYQTLQELVEAARANPKKIKIATTGTGGIPFVILTMMSAMNEVEFNPVAFDGDGSALTAILGGHVEVFPASVIGTGVMDMIKTGKLRPLAVVAKDRLEQLPDVPAITEVFPEYEKYMPIGHYYGVFVKKGTPEDIVQKLRSAFAEGVKDPKFTDYIQRMNGTLLGLTGQEAQDFLNKNQSNVALRWRGPPRPLPLRSASPSPNRFRKAGLMLQTWGPPFFEIRGLNGKR